MKKILIWYLILSSILIAEKAIIIVPVADLVGQPLASFYDKSKPVEQRYAQLAWAGLGKDHYYACPRLHQALLHEEVELIEIRGKEARIRLPNIFYQTYTNKNPQCDYWTLKSNVATMRELSKNNIDSSYFPTPISFQDANYARSNKNSITFTHAYYDKTTKNLISAGTRCLKTSKQKYKGKVSVYIYDNNTSTIKITHIPQSHIYEYSANSPQEKITQFIALLKKWTKTTGTIPYVWGGCSITAAHPTNDFGKKNEQYNKAPITSITRPLKLSVKGGLDCSGLIARAAQIVGIPYFFKNSYTITQKLEPLKPHESLQPGDIMWLSGHVLVVSGPNTLIEARHYDHGYGKIHEILLSEQFEGIRTTADLEKAFFAKQVLSRLDSAGKPAEKYPHFKLLKLASVWK